LDDLAKLFAVNGSIELAQRGVYIGRERVRAFLFNVGASLYENEFVKEDGAWKFSVDHTFNTWTAGYDGGWARNPGRGVPGPSKTFPRIRRRRSRSRCFRQSMRLRFTIRTQ
jgi:hypothetical protein